MKKQIPISVAVAIVLALLAVILRAGAAFASSEVPSVTLSVDSTSFAADMPVTVHVTIANNGKHPLKILKWYTPFDDVEGPLFSIQRDYGLPVAYTGPLYKRPKPAHDDYLHLKGGESITRDVDLAMYYDLSKSGQYSIVYDVSSTELYAERGSAKKEPERLTSNEIKVWIAGREAGSVADAGLPVKTSGTTGFNRCTTTQQAILVTARANASSYSADALSYLKSQSHQYSPRYITWFGAPDAARYETVTTHFTSISSAMDTAAVTFDCGCKKRYYAYVYPTRPYTIYLCRIFWLAPQTGTDSQAGTLIHEMSHFNTVASTSDYVYGQQGAMDLALTDPAKAVNNADNHEYFGENSPPLQ